VHVQCMCSACAVHVQCMCSACGRQCVIYDDTMGDT